MSALKRSRPDHPEDRARQGEEARKSPVDLMAVATGGLSRLTARFYRQNLRLFARHRGAPSAEGALRELAALGRDEAERVLDGFRAAMVAGGYHPGKSPGTVSAIRTAVRKLRAAGLTTLDLDRRRYRPAEHPPGPDDLMSVILTGLGPSTVYNYRAAYKAFQAYRGAPSAEGALRELIGMGRDEAAECLVAFRAHELARGHDPATVERAIGGLRRAARKLRAAGLTGLVLDGRRGPGRPRACYDPGGLTDLTLKELAPTTAYVYLTAYGAFQAYRGAVSADEALRELIGMGRDEANHVLDGFRVHLVAGGRVPRTAERAVKAVKTAARWCRSAGLTTLDLDVRIGRLPGDDDARDLVSVLLDGLRASTATVYRTAYRSFSRFRGTPSADEALRGLIGLDLVEAERMLDGFRAHLVADRVAPLTVEARVNALRRAVRKLRAAGLTTLDLDKPRTAEAGQERVLVLGESHLVPPIILNKQMATCFAKAEYDVMKALPERPPGLSTAELNFHSKHKFARTAIRDAIKRFPVLKPLIRRPKRKNSGGGFWIGPP